MKFKVGDRVRTIACETLSEDSVGYIGTITDKGIFFHFEVKMDFNGNFWLLHEQELELVDEV